MITDRSLRIVGTGLLLPALLALSGWLTTARAAPATTPAAVDAPEVDFNGDGYADLVVVGVGAVQVVYGGRSGLRAGDTRRFRRADLPAAPAGGRWDEPDRLQPVVADFDADGFGDLAIGDGAAVDGAASDAGAVHVLFGSALGLTVTRSQYWTQNSAGVPGSSESEDSFGSTVAAGDFDGDGRADLAVGAPGERVGTVRAAGAVTVLRGSADGLTADGSRTWTQNSPGVNGRVEEWDQFGRSLAAADFDGSGQADLAIGAPIESIGRSLDAGGVNVLYGSPDGITAVGDEFWSQATPGVRGRAESEDLFGDGLAAGHLAGTAYADLAIVVTNEFDTEGAVQIIHGTAGGLVADGNQLWRPHSPGLPRTSRASSLSTLR